MIGQGCGGAAAYIPVVTQGSLQAASIRPSVGVT